MSTKAKIGMWVVIAVVVVGGIWWWMNMGQNAVAPATGGTSSPTGATAQAPAPTPTNNPPVTDNSDASIQAGLSNVDSQMNGFTSDNASVNQGLSDQPVQQSQP